MSLQDAADLDANDATSVLEYLGKVVSPIFCYVKMCRLHVVRISIAAEH